MQLPPGDPDDPPAIDLEATITVAVYLERRVRFVSGTAVELGNQALLAPEAIHLDPLATHLKPSVEMRARQPKPIQNCEEELLQIAARGADRPAQSLEAEAQLRVATMTRMAGKQGR